MKSYKPLKLYKQNIAKNKYIIMGAFIFITAYMICSNLLISKQLRDNNTILTDFNLLNGHMKMSIEMVMYSLIYTGIIFKLLDFMDNYLYMLKFEDKNKLWSLVGTNIVISSTVFGFYITFMGYICTRIATEKMYTNIGESICILLIIAISSSIAAMIIGIGIVLLKITMKNNTFPLFITVGFITIDYYLGTFILLNLYWNNNYIKHNLLGFANIIKYFGIAILLFELGRFVNKKREIYSTKSKFGDGNEYEY